MSRVLRSSFLALAALAALGLVAPSATADPLPTTGGPSLPGKSVTMKPIGTILRIGGPGLLTVTQSFSVRATYAADGTPAVGEQIVFTQKNTARGASGHPDMDPSYVPPVTVCTAIVDSTGLATCRGTTQTSSLLTLLSTPTYANHELFPSVESTTVPILSIG